MKILLIDDERNFLDNREATVARDCKSAIEILKEDAKFDEIWLDYSLGRSGDILDALFYFEEVAKAGNPIDTKFVIHTSSGSGAHLIETILKEAGYSNMETINYRKYLDH